MEHDDQCKCSVCDKGLEQVIEDELRMIEKYGWFTHGVINEDGNSVSNIHTHYLPESYGHLDLEIAHMEAVLPEIQHMLLANAVKMIKEDKVIFVPGNKYKGIIQDPFGVEFIPSKESGRDVLRMIIPDKNNNTNKEMMMKEFTKQWDVTGE